MFINFKIIFIFFFKIQFLLFKNFYFNTSSLTLNLNKKIFFLSFSDSGIFNYFYLIFFDFFFRFFFIFSLFLLNNESSVEKISSKCFTSFYWNFFQFNYVFESCFFSNSILMSLLILIFFLLILIFFLLF